MSRFKIRITASAEDDLVDLFFYIAKHDCEKNALHVIDQLEKLILSLDENPQRGHIPPELDQKGIKDYKEVHFKPYRVIYEIIGSDVAILCCVDGRRDMQSLLERRLFR